MILPIIPYGKSILRKKCDDIEENTEELQNFIDAMWETMYKANGMGLAAPQVSMTKNLFIVDNSQVWENLEKEEREELFEGDKGIKETFINAKIVAESEEFWTDYEGCLSIPDLSAEVDRSWSIEIEYLDRNFKQQKKTFHGITARVIQHEFDHTEGVVYIDHLPPLKKRLMGGKLKKISNGQVQVNYKMKLA